MLNNYVIEDFINELVCALQTKSMIVSKCSFFKVHQ